MFVDQGLGVKADPYSFEGLIAWLENQPARKTYRWASMNCLGCQYLASHGIEPLQNYRRLPIEMRTDVFLERPYTFGAALTRAREALAART